MAGVALIGLMASPALAQSQDKTQPQQQQQQMSTGGAQQQLAQKDIDFAKKAAGDGMAEVKLGKLAQQQAENDQVKQFGQRMVDDHSKANDKLKSIAQQKGIDLPQNLPEEAQQAYDDLQKHSGHEFDQAYMDMMVEDHHKAIDLFQQETKAGKDADLQKFAEETLPTLQQHLDLAEKTQEQVTASADQGQAGNKQQASNQMSKSQGAAATAPAATQQQQATSETQQTPAMAPEPNKTQEQAATANPPATTGSSKTERQQAATETTTNPAAAATEPTNNQQQAATQPTGEQVKAEDVIGSKVVNNKGDEVGEIEDLVIDKDKVQYAVVSVGGFLGIGEKHVVVPLDQLKLGKDQAYLMSGETEDQLKKMPEYKEGEYQSQKQG
jgi:putative membrane protein